ncbi:MAG: AAA family ATPase [Myxococcaceae bacterium]
MDDATLSGLEAALALTPDNGALRLMVLRALVERDQPDRALRWITEKSPDAFSAEERLWVARVWLRTEQAPQALEFAPETPEGQVVRAQALLRLDRRDEASAAYANAVAHNPTLEDLQLKAELQGAIREVGPLRDGSPRLRVISHDNTDQTEVARLLSPPQPRLTFTDVGGLDEVKTEIRRRIILPFQKPSLFQKFKKRVGGGILLYGPPGCGKTLLARATAGECNATFLSVSISDILDMYIGESERKLHALFEKARSTVPTVLFFDELEALAAKRQYSREGTSSKLVSQFLSEMDGFSQNNSGVLVLGATNVPWALDPAFRRPGRFDRVVFIPPPDEEARRIILGLLLRDRPAEDGLDVTAAARGTSAFSGADLQNIVETASDLAIERSLDAGTEKPITQADLKAALKQVKPSALEWLTTARNYARYANESGQYDEVLTFLETHGRG